MHLFKKNFFSSNLSVMVVYRQDIKKYANTRVYSHRTSCKAGRNTSRYMMINFIVTDYSGEMTWANRFTFVETLKIERQVYNGE